MRSKKCRQAAIIIKASAGIFIYFQNSFTSSTPKLVEKQNCDDEKKVTELIYSILLSRFFLSSFEVVLPFYFSSLYEKMRFECKWQDACGTELTTKTSAKPCIFWRSPRPTWMNGLILRTFFIGVACFGWNVTMYSLNINMRIFSAYHTCLWLTVFYFLHRAKRI